MCSSAVPTFVTLTKSPCACKLPAIATSPHVCICVGCIYIPLNNSHMYLQKSEREKPHMYSTFALVEKRISIHPHKPHATSQPSQVSHTHICTRSHSPCPTSIGRGANAHPKCHAFRSVFRSVNAFRPLTFHWKRNKTLRNFHIT